MHTALEDYLERIEGYLAGRGRGEILEEIRSHIMDKTEAESGGIDEESLRRTIAAYGSPREVAAKYLEGRQIISPLYRGYLMITSAVLFALHAAVTIASAYVGVETFTFPFLYIPRMSMPDALFFLPVALVFDIGLAGLVFAVATRWSARPGAHLRRPGPVSVTRQRSGAVAPVLLGVLFCALLGLFLSQGAVVFQTLRFGGAGLVEPVPFDLPVAANHFISYAVLAWVGVEALVAALRFVAPMRWLRVGRSAFRLGLLCAGLALAPALVRQNPSSAGAVGTARQVLAVLSVLAGADLIRSLLHLARSPRVGSGTAGTHRSGPET